MSSVLRVVFMLTWDPREVAGGSYLWNNRTVYFHGGGVSVIPDIAEGLNLTVKTYFGNYYEAFDFVANGTAEMGGILTSQELMSTHGLVYLHPLDSETSNVYFRQPPADSVKLTIIRPFSKELWTALLLLMLVVSLTFRKNRKSSLLSIACRIFIHAFELLIGRHNVHICFKHEPASISVAKLIVSFFGTIISSVYIGKIASLFVMRENLVKTPNDLIKYGYKLNTYSKIHVKRVFEKQHVTAELINFTKDLSYITNVIGKPMEDPRQTLFSHSDGFYPPALYSLKYNQELCTISVLKSTRRTAKSFFIRKDSLLREDLNLRIVQLIERGINYRHQVKFKSKFKYNCPQRFTDYNQLTFKYVKLGFIPLVVGFAAAVVELVEILILRAKSVKKYTLKLAYFVKN